MPETDVYVMCVIQILLIIFAVFSIHCDKSLRKQESNASFSAEVERGEKSMTAIYTVYGATIASCLVLINEASAFDGNKVLVIVIDFSCITYLFFFSTWFRNSIFFPLYRLVRKD